MTRCKFKCDRVTSHEGGKRDVHMSPVFSQDQNSENKAFWDQSPGGNFTLNWINPNVEFVPGKEYYIDITEAPKGN